MRKTLTARQMVALCAALIAVALAVWAGAEGLAGVATGAGGLLLVALLAALLAYRNQTHHLDRQVRALRHEVGAVHGEVGTVRDEVGSVERDVDRLISTITTESLAEQERAKAFEAALADHETGERSRHREVMSHLRRLSYTPVVEIQALLQLQQLVPAFNNLPALGGWAMNPTNLLTVARHLKTSPPELVVECGSGSSTVWIANLLREHGHGRIVSLESDPDYADVTRRLLAELDLSDVAEVRDAPLRVDEDGGSPWYDARAYSNLRDVDVLLIDGPPKATAETARYPALPCLRAHLKDDAVIFLDDADRADEKEAVRRWLAEGLVADVGRTGAVAELRLHHPRDEA